MWSRSAGSSPSARTFAMLAHTPSDREATEGLSFGRQEGRFLAALGFVLLALPFIVQFVGLVSWAAAVWFLLFLAALLVFGRHQQAIGRRLTGVQWLGRLAIVLAGVLPVYAMLQLTTLEPDFAPPGASLLRALLRAGSGTSLPVLMALLIGADGLVSPPLRHRLYLLAGVARSAGLDVPRRGRLVAVSRGQHRLLSRDDRCGRSASVAEPASRERRCMSDRECIA